MDELDALTELLRGGLVTFAVIVALTGFILVLTGRHYLPKVMEWLRERNTLTELEVEAAKTRTAIEKQQVEALNALRVQQEQTTQAISGFTRDTELLRADMRGMGTELRTVFSEALHNLASSQGQVIGAVNARADQLNTRISETEAKLGNQVVQSVQAVNENVSGARDEINAGFGADKRRMEALVQRIDEQTKATEQITTNVAHSVSAALARQLEPIVAEWTALRHDIVTDLETMQSRTQNAVLDQLKKAEERMIAKMEAVGRITVEQTMAGYEKLRERLATNEASVGASA